MIETVHFPSEHKGARITVSAELSIPDTAARAPAMVIIHGSGGIKLERERRYVAEINALGVATLLVDSFKARSITTTVGDQRSGDIDDTILDAAGGLILLASDQRIVASKIGIVGFSRGGSVALYTSLRHFPARYTQGKLAFALHVPFYPWAGRRYQDMTTTSAPIRILLGAADTQVGINPCLAAAREMKRCGGDIDWRIFPNAPHGWDFATEYNDGRNAENWCHVLPEEQPDGSWIERNSGELMRTASGKPNEAGIVAMARLLVFKGAPIGPNDHAKTESSRLLAEYIKQFLL